MQNELMEKYIRISRIIITFMVFIILNTWFIFENDPHWIIATIISIVIFFINFPSSKICKFIINKGDKITNKILKALYYVFALPIIIFSLFCGIAIIYIYSIDNIPELGGTGFNSLGFGLGLLTMFCFAVATICIVVPYIQTLIVSILKHSLNLGNRTNEKN